MVANCCRYHISCTGHPWNSGSAAADNPFFAFDRSMLHKKFLEIIQMADEPSSIWKISA